MNATNLISLIVAISLAALAAGVYVNVTDQATTTSTTSAELFEQANLRVLSITAHQTNIQGAGELRIQVTSDSPVRLNDTVIRVQTIDGSELLEYSE